MKRLALCIGNNEYTVLPELACAVSDAEAVETKLKELGFDTILQTNLDREYLASTIVDFVERIENYDAVLLYYAGHGFQIDGDNILAPIDLDIKTKSTLVKYNAFPLGDLMELLNKYPEQTKIVILDACRVGLGNRGGFGDFAPVSAPQGSIIAFATSPGQSSNEKRDINHGIYTATLLNYIGLPRVPIETVFKKVRECLTAETGGTQVPWEHTSLIGDFYLNPDTIYDGVVYCGEALADSRYKFFNDIIIKGIVDELKSHSWPTQESGINKVNNIDFTNASGNDLFVLGRNIYQAADGSCFAVQRFIDSFEENDKITAQAKRHLLNGMLYEIYFNSDNKMRNKFKLGYYQSVITCVEKPEFYSSKEFIASELYKADNRVIYIPGQNELMEFSVVLARIDADIVVDDIIYHGKSIFYSIGGSRKANTDVTRPCRCYMFEQELAFAVVAQSDYIKVQYIGLNISRDTVVQIPLGGFSLRFSADGKEEDEFPFW